MGGFLEIPIASALFLLVFAGSLLRYLREPSAPAGVVVLLFGLLSPLFAVRLLSALFGFELAPPVQSLLLLGVLVQPLLTLWLASLLVPVPRWLLPAAAAAVLLSAPTVLLTLPQPPFPIVLLAVGSYVLTSLFAAFYFVRAASQRVGTARLRLVLAGTASVFMAATLMTLAVSTAVPNEAREVVAVAARYGVLLAALGFVLAFMPPGPLRRLLNARTGYELSRQLLAGSVEDDAPATWRAYLELAATTAGVEHACLLVGGSTGQPTQLAAVGAFEEFEGVWSSADFEQLRAHSRQADLRTLSKRSPLASALPPAARFLMVVPLDLPRSGLALLVLAGERRSLFSQDDSEILETLGRQAALLAGRAAAGAERIALAHRLTATVEALRTAHRAKSDFLASMSHELRTPLNAIMGFSDLMRSEPWLDGRRMVPDQWIEHVHGAGRHLLELINDVLDLAKVEAGRLDLQPERIDVAEAVGEAIAGLRPLAHEKQLQLSSQVEVPSLVADRGRLRQVLYNLLANAIKYTPAGGSIRVEATLDDGHARLSVQDTGVGISADDQERVFEEFTQVGDAAARREGTGLGLTLTRRLVEAHGGQLTLESELGVGSTFTVRLPLARSDEAAPYRGMGQPAAEPPVRPSLPGRAGALPLVLVIEDDPQAVVLLRSCLEPSGYRMAVAADGETGLESARTERPAAILLDVLLPGADGWEVLRRLKADSELRDIPVLMLTVVDEREVGLALGAVDYLVKPIERSALLAALSRHVPGLTNGRRPRVLAVDDDPAALEVVRAALRERDCELVLAGSGAQALDEARSAPLDLVICDLIMPDLDGFEVIARLRADPATSDVPILVLTSHQLTEADKHRLNGQILGICEKGDDVPQRLGAWLGQVTAAHRSGG